VQRDGVQVQPAHHRVMVGEPAFQRQGQVRHLGAGPADGQVRHHRAAPLPVDERLDHRGRSLAGNLGGDRAELDAG